MLDILINSSIRESLPTSAISEVNLLSICQSLFEFLVLISFSVCVRWDSGEWQGWRAGRGMCLGNDIHETIIVFVNIIILYVKTWWWVHLHLLFYSFLPSNVLCFEFFILFWNLRLSKFRSYFQNHAEFKPKTGWCQSPCCYHSASEYSIINALCTVMWILIIDYFSKV